MIDTINSASIRAIRFNADGATKLFYQRLREGRFQSTRCTSCAHIPFPPRLFCPKCGGSDVEWVDLPQRGELYAFSQQARALRFTTPDVLGIVDLEGVGFVFTRINAPIEELEIGQQVAVGFHEISPELTVHQFSPV